MLEKQRVDLITNINIVKWSIIVIWDVFEHSIDRMLDALSGRKQLRCSGTNWVDNALARSLAPWGNPLDIWQC